MKKIFTARQAKNARISAQLSQGKVATDLGINRSYLSLFESGKYVLDDSMLTRLQSYYEDYGASPDDNDDESGTGSRADAQQSSEETGVRLRDGFLLTDAMDDRDADTLLTEYAENRQMIATLCATDLSKGFFVPLLGVDTEDVANRVTDVIMLMARNFALVEQLQGHETVAQSTLTQATPEKRTTGDFVRARFAEAFGSRYIRAVPDEKDNSVAGRDKRDNGNSLIR